MKEYGWGILGTGRIAHRFMTDLSRCRRARLSAVGSRSSHRAEDFASQYGFLHAYASYEEVMQDPDVDVVYVATPHPFHCELTRQALTAGKAVLCEKPAAVNGRQARQMIQEARTQKQFFMEAMWTRFFPVNRQVKKIVDRGVFGPLILIEVDFGFGRFSEKKVTDTENRLYAPHLAGGSLLDVGVYCVSYATWMKGEKPCQMKALSTPVETGVDGMTACLFQYSDGSMAVLRSSIIQETRLTATLYCERAMIEIPEFYHPEKAMIHSRDDEWPNEVITDPCLVEGGTGFNYEAEEVMRCLDEGLLESPLMSWQQTIDVMDLLDAIRKEIGLLFPFE